MSILLKTATRFLVQIMLVLSVLLVIRGHNFPGGGFIGALIASAAIALYHLSFNLNTTEFDKWSPRLCALGVACLVLSFVIPLFYHLPALTGLWTNFQWFHERVKLGTPLLFDFGIYFLIVGSVSWVIAVLEDKP